MAEQVTIPRGTPNDDGPRWYLFGGVVFVTCGECSFRSSLDHDIAGDGTVTPSLECPADGCDWHVNARLEGWYADR